MHDHVAHTGHTTQEEQIALLSYMVAHNKSHAEEVHEMAHDVQGPAADLLHEALELYNAGTQKLAEALQLIKDE